MLLEYFLPWLSGRNLANLALAFFCALSIITFAKPALLPKQINQLVSKIIHVKKIIIIIFLLLIDHKLMTYLF